jgi:16S rRNA (guanine(527)-N(7))-methyltransferase RsmG
MTSAQSIQDELEGEIDALASRHGLTDQSAGALQGLVGLVDWEEPNFVPKSGGGTGRGRRQRDLASQRRVASNLLSESLAGLALEPVRAARRMADIGSGAGFPGLVLGAALPEARMTLIEKMPEKCSFLREASAELGLDNVEVVEGPVQRWSAGLGACDAVTSRKVGRLNTIVGLCAPLLAPGGVLVLWQGPRDPAKEAPAAEAADAAGLRLSQVVPIGCFESPRGQRVEKHLYLYERTGAG